MFAGTVGLGAWTGQLGVRFQLDRGSGNETAGLQGRQSSRPWNLGIALRSPAGDAGSREQAEDVLTAAVCSQEEPVTLGASESLWRLVALAV